MTAYEQIEELVDKFVQAMWDHGPFSQQAIDVRATLLAAVKALAEDAERYRWLRQPGDLQAQVCTLFWADDLDEQVDKARQSTTSAGEKP